MNGHAVPNVEMSTFVPMLTSFDPPSIESIWIVTKIVHSPALLLHLFNSSGLKWIPHGSPWQSTVPLFSIAGQLLVVAENGVSPLVAGKLNSKSKCRCSIFGNLLYVIQSLNAAVSFRGLNLKLKIKKKNSYFPVNYRYLIK